MNPFDQRYRFRHRWRVAMLFLAIISIGGIISSGPSLAAYLTDEAATSNRAYLPMIYKAAMTATPTRPTVTPSPTVGTQLPPPVGSGEWTQFRGDAQHTAATNLQLGGNLTIRWKRSFAAWPHVFSELVITGGRVYLANTDGKVTCLNGTTGDTCWEFDTGAPIVTTPATANGRLHVVNVKGRVVTLDLVTGQKLWEYTVPGGVYASPALTGGKLFFGTVLGVFYAFDAAQGGNGPAWTYNVGAMIDTAPVELNGKIIFAAESMKAYALNAANGQLVWSTSLPGSRTWNGHPVASVSTDRVYFSVLNEFYQETQTYREVADTYTIEKNNSSLSNVISYMDSFIGQNRTALQPGVILVGSTGQTITDFTISPSNTHVSGLPFTHYYWGSIRPALWQGYKLYIQGLWRNILVDMQTNRIYQPNADGAAPKYFVRGDEQVPTTIGGNRAYGGIGINVAYLDLNTGVRGNVLGNYGSETNDSTPLTAPISTEHYISFPGDGYTENIGAFIVANSHGYYAQYGWVYCFDGTVTQP